MSCNFVFVNFLQLTENNIGELQIDMIMLDCACVEW